MKKTSILFILFFMLGLSSSLSAQTFSLNSLKGKTWRAVSGYNLSDKMNLSIYFYSAYATYNISSKDNQISKEYNRDFYLSDTIVKSIDRSKVGKIKTGKYIIRCDSKSYEARQKFSVFEIISLTSNKLVLKTCGSDKLTITYVTD